MSNSQRRFRRIGVIGHARYPALAPTLTALSKFAEANQLSIATDRELSGFLPDATDLIP